MKKVARRSQARLLTSAAKRRFRETLVRFIAEQLVQDVRHNKIAGMIERLWGIRFETRDIARYKYRYMGDPAVLDAARKRVATGAITTGPDEPDPDVPKPGIKTGRAAKEEADREAEAAKPKAMGRGYAMFSDQEKDRYLALARDKDAFLARMSKIFYDNADPRIAIQAGKVVAEICGYATGEAAPPDDTALRARAKKMIDRAMQVTGHDEDTVVAELSKRVPEFNRWYRPVDH